MYCGGYDSEQIADRLARVFPNARILVIVREQRSMIRSLYNTMISWGMPHTLQRVLNPPDIGLSPQFNLAFLHYDRLVDYYRNRFGEDRLLVLPFEQFSQSPFEFVRSISVFSGNTVATETELHTLPFRARKNAKKSLLNLKIQRWMNRVFVSSCFNYSGWFADSSDRAWKRLEKCARREKRLPRFTSKWYERGFREQVERATDGQFAGSNRRLCEIIGLDLAKYGYQL
jgi:hypothetical protein